MCSVLLYVYYDDPGYCYYFSASINDELVFNNTSMDDLCKLFEYLEENDYNDPDIRWCIFTDPNGREWNYAEEFQRQGHNVTHDLTISSDEMLRTIKNNFSYLISISETDNIYDKIKILNPCRNDDDGIETSGIPVMTEGIPDSGPISELARIIEEIYKHIK